MGKIEKEKFIKKMFIVCGKCGYNNEKHRFQHYGFCLRCKNVMDERLFFKYQLWLNSKKRSKSRDTLSF